MVVAGGGARRPTALHYCCCCTSFGRDDTRHVAVTAGVCHRHHTRATRVCLFIHAALVVLRLRRNRFVYGLLTCVCCVNYGRGICVLVEACVTTGVDRLRRVSCRTLPDGVMSQQYMPPISGVMFNLRYQGNRWRSYDVCRSRYFARTRRGRGRYVRTNALGPF